MRLVRTVRCNSASTIYAIRYSKHSAIPNDEKYAIKYSKSGKKGAVRTMQLCVLRYDWYDAILDDKYSAIHTVNTARHDDGMMQIG